MADELNYEEQADLLKQIVGLKKQRQELNKQAVKDEDAIKNITKDLAKTRADIRGFVKTENEIIGKTVKELKEGRSVEEKRRATSIERYGLERKILEIEEKSNQQRSAISEQIIKSRDLSEDSAEILSNTLAQQQSIKGLYESQAEALTDIVRQQYNAEDTTEKRLQLNQMIELSEEKLLTAKTKADQQSLQASIDALNVSKQQLDLYDKESQKLEMKSAKLGEIHGKVMQPIDGMFSFIQGMPGGGYLGKALGLDSLRSSIDESLVDGLQNGLGSGIKTMGVAKLKMLAIAGAAAAIGFALYKGWQQLNKISEMQSEIAKEQGLSLNEAQQQVELSTKWANESNSVWVTSEGIRKSMAAVRDQLGGMLPPYDQMNEKSKQLVMDQMALTDQLGLSQDEATQFQEQAQLMGISTQELIGNVAQVEKAIESTTGGTLNTKEVMQEVAKIPPGITAGFKGTTTELVATVAKAKALGMSFEQIHNIGEGMLDIESSLGKEMEARVLTGKNLNLDTARQLQLTGDTAGLMDELLKQAGTYSEFKEMDHLQQKAMADAMGMSTDEMSSMLQKAELQAQVGQDLTKLSAEDLENKIKAGKISGDTAKSEAEKLLREKQSASINESIGKVWTKIKDVIFGLVAGPLGKFANSITEMLNDSDAISGIIETVKVTFSVISSIVGGIVDVISFVLQPAFWLVSQTVSRIGAFLGGIWDGLKSGASEIQAAFQPVIDIFSEMFSGGEEGGESFFSTVMDFVNQLSSVFMPVISSIGKLLATSIIAPFKLIANIAGGIVKIFTGDFMGGLEQIGGGIVSFILDPFYVVWDGIKGVFSNIVGLFGANELGAKIINGLESIGQGVLNAILWPFKEASKWILGLFGGNSPSELGLRILDGISSIASSLFDVMTTPFSMVWDFIGGLFGMDNLGTTIIENIKAIFGQVVSVVTDTIGGVADMIGGLFGGDDEAETSDTSVSVTPVPSEYNTDETGNATVQSTSISNGESGMGSNQEIVELLKAILVNMAQPIHINYNGQTIQKLDEQTTLNRNMRVGMDNTFGKQTQ